MCPSQRDVPGCPGNPGILSIPGSLCALASGMSRDVLGIPGYLVLCAPATGMSRDVLGIPGYLVLCAPATGMSRDILHGMS